MKNIFLLIFLSVLLGALSCNQGSEEKNISNNLPTINMPSIPKSRGTSVDYQYINRGEKNPYYIKEKAKVKIGPEEIVRFVDQLYYLIFNQEVSENELQKWGNVLVQGGSFEGVYQGFVKSDIFYNQVKNSSSRASVNLSEFLGRFVEKFTNLSWSEDFTLKQNPMALAAGLTDEVLSISDELSGENFIAYYSIMSSDLAKVFVKYKSESPPIAAKEQQMINQLRLQTDPMTHFNWCKKKKGFQIKGEMVLKIHLAINILQISK